MPSLFKSPKIKSLRQLKRLVSEAKQKGKRVVLANGCFDLIHVGHIRYLEAAKKKGDMLIVALNSDRSVSQLKGSARPLLPAAERDFILIFDEPRVDNILRQLRPDVHVKGSDYRRSTVPERETTKELGIKVAIVGGPKIRSTSTIIRRLAKKLAAGENK